MTYKLTNSTSITRIEDSATIPADPENTDYQKYLAWVAAGNVPAPYDTRTAAQILADTKTEQITLVTQSCGAQIVAGFQSSALGSAHTYPSQPFDQTNLIGAVASGLATIYFWCADSTGTWAITPHTAAQIKQVLADAGTTRMGYSSKLKTLIDNINAIIESATAVADVKAIVW